MTQPGLPRRTLPAPPPRVTVENEPFWSATRKGVLVLPRCQRCKRYLWYPKTFCSACGTVGVDWVQASGTGTVYSYTVVHTTRAVGPYADAVPYVLAYVELDEGPRMMTNIVDCPEESVYIGQRVTVVFDDTCEGPALPRFRPVAG